MYVHIFDFDSIIVYIISSINMPLSIQNTVVYTRSGSVPKGDFALPLNI